ncbi:pilus assembly protein PilC [Pseudomonas sp. PA1(2017)]|uniref:pilus assembly protein n=1 Tax=Pseudomonas sp. PA1(2017) TaxID=1932113 RepID=UPI000960C5DC|nr:PilC/PilY family type IV pilus protein [Pseudomonas sp. PA1(2017)]OLU20773.1 pilus assembly protein PilC [Pseudomonas sp. PA1(2017)]
MNYLVMKFKAAKTLAAFLLTSGILISAPSYARVVSQAPLLLGSGSVPGNLALVPSVEYPTVISAANLGAYTHTSTYTGYFDSAKCYKYQREAITDPYFGEISGRDGGGYFTPVRVARDCSLKDEWSGNYLNWATTQTIDPFRKALTGGYRVVDTPTKTILAKATRANRGDSFGERTVSTNLTQIVPYTDINRVRTVIFSGSDYQKNKAIAVIRRSTANGAPETTEYFSVRVEVCKQNLLESNCKKYGDNWKPEGLLQQYSETIRYSAFSYLNQDGNGRNGGVMRAEQSYIGQIKRTPGTPEAQVNPTPEWSADTGILVQNPYNDSIGNSGIINYINKFGELSNRHKSNDPVSELYYTALRYFKNQGNVPSYSDNLNDTMRDNFPVITNWAGKDPIQYACQKNVILGIGDVNSHQDRDLPAADDDLDVNDWTQTVFDLEGVGKRATAGSFNGNGNSAYIAGLAYYANTTDIRADLAGKQTLSTHWVDVREGGILRDKANNQYWLAAKYGGFKVPDGYKKGDPLPTGSWRTTNDVLSTGDPRPDNFYVASDAENMVESLKLAFAKIAQETQSSTTSLASNSTRLATDTAVFQSSLNSKYWSGDLLARKVNTNGTTATSAAWSASAKLDAQNINNRKIFTSAPLADASPATNGQISTTATAFSWGTGGLSSAQKNLLATTAERNANNLATAESRLNYLRGDRSLERTDSDATKLFRQRGSRLGDIINSDPQYVADPDFGYTRLTGSVWADARAAYASFRSGNANRKPMVIVGANDGMLHGFNASMADGGAGGEELFAFIPNGVFENLIRLTDPAYAHRYYVDGTPRVSDVWAGNSWKTIVAGTTGAGGRSVFALDITDPDNMGSNKFLWEFSHPDMGNTIGQPAIVALPNGKFSVVVTTGYRTTAQTTAKIWFLDATDGSVIRTMDITTGGDLGAPLLADTNGDQVADKLYVGDTTGKLWRADISGSTPSGWDNPTLMFTATDGTTAQPITAPLSSAFNDKGQHMVLFGTGSYMFVGDNEIPTTPAIQSFYGIIDAGTFPIVRSDLLAQEILSESTVGSFKARTISNSTLANQRGWYLDLAWKSNRNGPDARGERVVSKATLRTDRVTFTTMTPSADPCASGGTSFVMALSLSSGSRLNYTYFDTNKDGSLNDSDDLGTGDEKLPVSGISDPDAGVIKGVTPLFRWLCYSGSSGAAPTCIKVPGSQRYGRNAWQEVR